MLKLNGALQGREEGGRHLFGGFDQKICTEFEWIFKYSTNNKQ